MKIATIKLFIGVLLSLLWVGCQNGDDPDPAPSKSQLLTQSWQISKLTINGGEQPTAGISIRFNSNNTYSVSGVFFNIPSSGTWELNPEENRIFLNSGNASFSIENMTVTNMVLQMEQQNFKSGVVTLRFEMIKS